MIIDTHSHLDGPEFADDLPQVIQRAQEAGVDAVLVPNVNLAGLPHLLQVCQTYQDYLFPMIGLHPEDVKEDYQAQLDAMKEQLDAKNGQLDAKKGLSNDVHMQTDEGETSAANGKNTFVAVGEIGLDFYWDDTFRAEQIDAFEQQIGWAVEYNLPLMIHARNAHRELVDIMEQHRNDNLQGVFHCFTGTADEARELLSFPGFRLGIGGVLTFKKSTLPDVLREAVPLDKIVLETDSPYLAPVPHRGKRNESSFIVATAEKLAEVYGLDLTFVATETTKNACFLLNNHKKCVKMQFG